MFHKPVSFNSFVINLVIIIVFGLIILASATAVVGYAHFGGDNYYYLKHQLLFGLLPGVILFWVCLKVPYRFWQKKAGWILLLALILLCLVFVPGMGERKNNALSWIKIGSIPLGQPAEFAKLALIIYLAAWSSKIRDKIKSLGHGLLPFLIILLIFAGLIALQPDVGTMVIIGLIALGIYFAAGARWKHLLGLLVVAGAALTGLIVAAPYRLNRFLVFLEPEKDLQGVGYHLQQALIAVGSGGWLGFGLGHSRQKFEYLPEVAGDSIFAVMAEEIGFIFSIIFICLLVALVWKIFKNSKFTHDDFVKYFSVGLAVWIGGQSMINIGAMVGILPLTGVPLPFVSYGGTALMALLAGCGILAQMLKD